MMTLLAHHIEPHHLPVLAIIFVTGCRIGWEAVSSLLSRRRRRRSVEFPGPETL